MCINTYIKAFWRRFAFPLFFIDPTNSLVEFSSRRRIYTGKKTHHKLIPGLSSDGKTTSHCFSISYSIKNRNSLFAAPFSPNSANLLRVNRRKHSAYGVEASGKECRRSNGMKNINNFEEHNYGFCIPRWNFRFPITRKEKCRRLGSWKCGNDFYGNIWYVWITFG